ncbi:MAG: polyprenyl synthetase family protein [Verrucomicrobiota bacterium]
MDGLDTIYRISDSISLSEITQCIRRAITHGNPASFEDTGLNAFDHHFRLPGKQMRSRVCLQASESLGLDYKTSIQLAATVEALHNASLILDDFQDGALERRGSPSVCALFGRDVALTLTLRLTTAAFICLTSTPDTGYLSQLVKELHRVVTETSIGQTRDLDVTRETTAEDLKVTASLKSGPLFGLSISLPLIATGQHEHVDQTYKIAKLFGLGYQILDDVSDTTGDSLQAADSNLVNCWSKDLGKDMAKAYALESAEKYLNKAKLLATEMPDGCGAAIIGLITQLQESES